MGINFSSGSMSSPPEPGVNQQIIRRYSSNATYTAHSTVKYIQVHCIGGGGGSSSATNLSGDEAQDSRGFGGAGAGAYSIGTYTRTGSSFGGNIVVGAGGEGGQDEESQFFGGSNGGDSKFQPTGSYSGTEGALIGERGQGASAGTSSFGEGGEVQSGTQFVSIAGEDGQTKTGSGGEHTEAQSGRGGHAPLTSGRTYGQGANGRSGAEEGAGNDGQKGVVFIYEYRGS